MLNHLSAKGIYISAGSACSSKKNIVSSSLIAFGLDENDAQATVRVSLDISNTEEEIMNFCKALAEGVNILYGKNKRASSASEKCPYLN